MKLRMELDLRITRPAASGFSGAFHRLADSSPEALGELLLDAYQDTVDYDGEALEDAVAEVRNVLDGGYGPFSEQESACIGHLHQPYAALFVVQGSDDDLVLAYVVTAKRASRRGYATALILRCLGLALQAGKSKVTLYVTETNRPAVALYESLGFTDVYLPLPIA